MDSSLSKLKDLLFEILYYGDQHSHLLIEENDTNSSLKKVTIYFKEDFKNWFSFSPDSILSKIKFSNKKTSLEDVRHSKIAPLLKAGNQDDKHNKACDSVIFLLEDASLYILLIEMKSSLGNGEVNTAKLQIKNTKIFLKYFLELASDLYDIKFSKPAIFCDIILHKQVIPKKPTIKHGSNDSEKIRIIAVSNNSKIPLKQLIN